MIEVLSPNDETYAKLPFYAAHHADEIVIVDPATRELRWLKRDGTVHSPVAHGAVLAELSVATLAAAINWPS